MLSGLNINMGILESPVPDLFSEPLAAWSTWESDFFTKDGSDKLTFLKNTAGTAFPNMTAFYAGGLQEMQIFTDGDGTIWMGGSSAWPNFANMILAADVQATMDEDSEGIIFTQSVRASQDQTGGSGKSMEGWGPGGGISPGVMFGASSSTDPYSPTNPLVDMELRFQWTNGLTVNPGGDTQVLFGPYRGELGTGHDMNEGGYNPDGNVFTLPAYRAGDDIVMSLFMQNTGIRLMINGQFVQMKVSSCRNADGSLKAAPYGEDAENAFFSQDCSIPQLLTNMGKTPGVDSSAIGLGGVLSSIYGDYHAVHSGSKKDNYMRAVHSILLNSKPV